jgi:hypothetical protein
VTFYYWCLVNLSWVKIFQMEGIDGTHACDVRGLIQIIDFQRSICGGPAGTVVVQTSEVESQNWQWNSSKCSDPRATSPFEVRVHKVQSSLLASAITSTFARMWKRQARPRCCAPSKEMKTDRQVAKARSEDGEISSSARDVVTKDAAPYVDVSRIRAGLAGRPLAPLGTHYQGLPLWIRHRTTS